MSKTGLQTISCLVLILVFCAIKLSGAVSQVQGSASGAQTELESLKAQLSGYRTWTLVNPRPVLMDSVRATDCAAPSIRVPDPHSNKYISVYVNDARRNAMMSEKYPKFPQGSIIVKAKSNEGTSGPPELLTIMVKQSEGYDHVNGDWQYLVMDGDGKKIETPSNIQSCQRCHLARKDTDYVSRAYLPAAIREKLK